MMLAGGFASQNCFGQRPELGQVQRDPGHLNRERLRGLLMGSLIGDALGGPLEFADDQTRRDRVPDCRQWDDQRRLDAATLQQLGKSLKMTGYAEVRPKAEPYGQWIDNAPEGTLTDDSRLKIVLMRALRAAIKPSELSTADIARQIIAFQPKQNQPPNPAVQRLIDEGLAEYRFAANWLLGERDPKIARPLDRLWAGVPNCSGQMMMLPLAGCFQGDTQATYQKTFELDFIDGPAAKDITAALVAGLASVISAKEDALTNRQRYTLLFQTMRDVDPYQLSDVPYVGRPLIKWLDLADSIVQRAGGEPKVAYQLLETEGKPVYYWDAHFTLLVPIVLLKLCHYEPLAALHLTIDFGHDTDSYAQLLGAIVGAVEGSAVFPQPMIDAVTHQLHSHFAESVDSWCDVLGRA